MNKNAIAFIVFVTMVCYFSTERAAAIENDADADKVVEVVETKKKPEGSRKGKMSSRSKNKGWVNIQMPIRKPTKGPIDLEADRVYFNREITMGLVVGFVSIFSVCFALCVLWALCCGSCCQDTRMKIMPLALQKKLGLKSEKQIKMEAFEGWEEKKLGFKSEKQIKMEAFEGWENGPFGISMGDKGQVPYFGYTVGKKY